MATTKAKITNPVIQQARVLDVDITAFTLTVATQFAKKPLSNVSFAVPYLHQYRGEGVHFLPEVGSVCWVCEPSDGNMPFVMGWAAAQDEGDFRANRRDMNPGDIYLGTRDGNSLFLRRGGVVQIGSTSICQRIYMPIGNIINDFCSSYGLHTLGGDLTWTVAIPEKVTTGEVQVSGNAGKQATLLTVSAREYANDPNPIAVLEIGSQEGDSDTILSLLINSSGQKGATQGISLKFSKSGSAEWTFQKDVTWKLQGKLSIQTQGTCTVTAADNINVHSDKTISVTASSDVSMSANGDIKLTAGGIVKVINFLDVGGASYPVVLATPAFIAFVASHSHGPTPSPGAPGGIPLPPCVDFMSKVIKST